MGVRGGDSYVSGLRAHPKNVWIAGRKVADVTQDPACADPWQPWRRSMIARSTMSCGER